jgi:hypothetical protein
VMTVRERFKPRRPRPKGAETCISGAMACHGALSLSTRTCMSLSNWTIQSYLLPVVTYCIEVWAPPFPRQRGRVDLSSPAFHSSLKDFEALLCDCLYTSSGLRSRSGSWQDRARGHRYPALRQGRLTHGC